MTSPFASTTRATIALLLMVSAPEWAMAHPGAGTDGSGFAAGLYHPFTGLDHLLAMFSLGLWSALPRARRLAAAPLAFTAALVVGFLLGNLIPTVEPMIAASLLGLGLLLASGARLPPVVGLGMAATFALFHGAAHGQELAGAASAGGMVIASILLQLAGMAASAALPGGPGSWLPRAAGTGVALFGASLLLA